MGAVLRFTAKVPGGRLGGAAVISWAAEQLNSALSPTLQPWAWAAGRGQGTGVTSATLITGELYGGLLPGLGFHHPASLLTVLHATLPVERRHFSFVDCAFHLDCATVLEQMSCNPSCLQWAGPRL